MEFETDEPTRERVARSILEEGPSTAAVLASRLDLTPAAVRRHLDHLATEGAVEARDARSAGTTRGRATIRCDIEGRPDDGPDWGPTTEGHRLAW